MIHSSEIFLIGGTRRSIAASCLTTSKWQDEARNCPCRRVQTRRFYAWLAHSRVRPQGEPWLNH